MRKSPAFAALILLVALPAAGDTGISSTATVCLVPSITGFTASPTAIAAGQSATLTWESVGGVTASIDNGVGAVPVSGSTVVKPSITTTYTLTVTNPGGTSTLPTTIIVVDGCARPAKPTFTAIPAGSVLAGNTFTLTWTHTLVADPLGSYRLDLSPSADCSATPKPYPTTESTVTVQTESGKSATFCAVVRAVSGSFCPSDASAPVVIQVRPAPASFVVSQDQRPEGVAVAGTLPPSGTTVAFKNIGSQAADLNVRSVRGFFTPEPRVCAAVGPGQTCTVAVVFDSFVTAAAGFLADALVGRWTDPVDPKEVSTAITLTVLSSPRTTLSQGSRLQLTPTNEIHFVRPAGEAPPPQVVTVRNSGTAPVRLAYSIGPGGAWITLAGDVLSAIQPGGTRTFTLGVDRSKRTDADGKPPISTYLTFASVDGLPTDRTVLQIFDEEPSPPVSGNGRPDLVPGDSSLIFGSSVSVAVPDRATFLSDGWIRNKGSSEAAVDVYYTPDGSDGLTGNVRKSTLTLQPYGTYRLADFVRGLSFVGSSGGSGHVEIRSSRIADLAARTTVDALTQKGGAVARYGAEIPTVRSFEGASRTRFGGAPLILAGIKGGEGSGFRTNVILSETAGRSLGVSLTLVSENGAPLGQVSRSVPPYSKVQVNFSEAALFPANVNYDGASLEVKVLSGDGALAAFATVLDNVSQGYTTRSGRFVADEIAKARRAAGGLASLASVVQRIVIPAAAHARGRNDTFFTTTLYLRNGTGADASVTIAYLPDGGASVPSKVLTIPARGSRTFTDVLGRLFGFTDNTAGMLVLEGGVSALVVSSDTSTQLDLADSSKGVSPSTIAAYAPESPEALGNPDKGAPSVVVAHPGLEESYRFRTNLVLAEIEGKPVTVRVKIIPPNTHGAALAEHVYALGPFERKQVNSFIPTIQGQDPGDLPAQYIDIETVVEWVTGDGRAVVLATKIDNDPASKRIDAYVLGPTGRSQGSIGF